MIRFRALVAQFHAWRREWWRKHIVDEYPFDDGWNI